MSMPLTARSRMRSWSLGHSPVFTPGMASNHASILRFIPIRLRDEGVDTSLLKLVDDALTPFTGVIEFELGDSFALNWPNQREVRLDIRDVDRLSQHFATCDAVLLTFEIPNETLQHSL